MARKKPEILIKIGHQGQADKDIFLHRNGSVICGRFTLKDGTSKRYRKIYEEILRLTIAKPAKGILDISAYKVWDAVRIYDEYLVEHWVKSVSAKTIERMANETAICRLIDTIKPDFSKALRKKWKKIFMAWEDKDDPATPRNAWQIL